MKTMKDCSPTGDCRAMGSRAIDEGCAIGRIVGPGSR